MLFGRLHFIELTRRECFSRFSASWRRKQMTRSASLCLRLVVSLLFVTAEAISAANFGATLMRLMTAEAILMARLVVEGRLS
jgi:hypothetical protein